MRTCALVLVLAAGMVILAGCVATPAPIMLPRPEVQVQKPRSLDFTEEQLNNLFFVTIEEGLATEVKNSALDTKYRWPESFVYLKEHAGRSVRVIVTRLRYTGFQNPGDCPSTVSSSSVSNFEPHLEVRCHVIREWYWRAPWDIDEQVDTIEIKNGEAIFPNGKRMRLIEV